MNLYPLLFEPNLHKVVWGGNRLESYKGMASSDEPIGESWEVSAVPSSTSVIANGALAGRLLTDVIAEHPVAVLVKFIDAKQDLSIQVHPNDEMSQREHGKFGKTEMWYVIDAEPGSYLYAGFKKQISPEEYKKHIADGTITDVLAKHEVKAGDVFYLPLVVSMLSVVESF